MRTLTGIYAHPDDETFSAGGTFAKYSAAGVRCTLFCATPGDAGKAFGEKPASRSQLAALRRGELRAAATILGIAEVEQRDHPDGALAGVDQDALIGEIVAHIRRERPDVIVTFGPEGAPNTHVDHRAISRAATAAFFLAENERAYAEQLSGGTKAHRVARLYYVTWPVPQGDAELQVRGVPATAQLDVRSQLERERSAFDAHASQGFLRKRFEELGATEEEWFALAAGTAQPAPIVSDLFAGL